MDEGENVFRFGQVKGGKSDENELPVNDYIVIDLDDEEFTETGFLIFTPYHLAIMRDDGKGAIPVLCVPINRVKAAMINEEITTDAEELPF